MQVPIGIDNPVREKKLTKNAKYVRETLLCGEAEIFLPHLG